MNLNYLWFSPVVIAYLIVWVIAIYELKDEYANQGLAFFWIGLHISTFIIIPTIIGLSKILN